jgi:hypothetical protein
METIGISPKVKAFMAAVGGPGIVLLILGVIIDDDTLRTVGLSLIGGGTAGGFAGYRAKPGAVATTEAEIRDLHDADGA